MIYAVISDIHGNYPAFEAVVADAKSKGAQAFLLLGDYIRDTPTLNEVVDTIRSLPNCTAILGNGDIGVISLDESNPETCEYEQLLPNFWSYKNLSRQNIEFLKSLPETVDIKLSEGKIIHLSHSISLIHHNPRLGAFHSGDYARKMEQSPFAFEEGIQNMQMNAERYSAEVANYPGDICAFGHNHLQFLGVVAGKTLLNPGSCGMPSDYDIRAPYALIIDKGNDVEIQLHRVEYNVEETIQAILAFDDFAHAKFWGRLRAAILRNGSDIPMSRFWQLASIFGKGKYPMENDEWRKTIDSFEFDYNWGIEEWKNFGEKLDMIYHYDAIIDEIDDPLNYKVVDPAHDPEQLKEYMNKWDGAKFIDAMHLDPNKSVLEVGVGTGRLAVRVCGKCKDFTGIDISPKTIKRATTNLNNFCSNIKKSKNMNLICDDYLKYEFDKTFDIIYSSLTFMHIKDKQAAIQKTFEILTSGGRFVLSIDKNKQRKIDYGTRCIIVYPDVPEEINRSLIESKFVIENQFETEFAVVFVATKE